MSTKPLTFGAELDSLIDDIPRALRRVTLMARPFHSRHRLGPRGLWILRYIRKGFVSQSELATRLVISSGMLSAELKLLVAAKMVVRSIEEPTGRRRLMLTQKAKLALVEHQREFERVLTPIFDGLSIQERNRFFALLEALGHDMPSADPAHDDASRLRQLDQNRKVLCGTPRC